MKARALFPSQLKRVAGTLAALLLGETRLRLTKSEIGTFTSSEVSAYLPRQESRPCPLRGQTGNSSLYHQIKQHVEGEVLTFHWSPVSFGKQPGRDLEHGGETFWGRYAMQSCSAGIFEGASAYAKNTFSMRWRALDGPSPSKRCFQVRLGIVFCWARRRAPGSLLT